ncbi:MAG: TRAP transporter large permease subunit [Alphaproteobacteria bacterium]|jgi:tripartite ATP-independent transporter DctM subunit|nr:TRAP transporter large permease subunit [Alphaproteobacteria bacterium]
MHPGADLALLLAMLVLLVIGTPIGVALGLAGVIGILIGLNPAMLGTVGTNSYNAIAKYPLIAIPLFILTGTLFERSGVAARLVRFARALVGPRRGGMALVAILVCLILGGMSGSGPADAAAVATILIPSMVRAGYPAGFSAGLIAASASTAILIPPSVALIVYTILVPGVDLRALFAAGLVPGLLAAAILAIPAIWLTRRAGFGAEDLAPRPPLLQSFLDAAPGLMAPVIILGGLRSGLFTPTETAAVAVAYSLLVGGLLYRSLSWGTIYRALADSAQTSAVVMIIIALAGIFAWAGSTLGAFNLAAGALLSLSSEPWVVLGLVLVFLLLAGMVLDGISIYLIAVPLLIPVARAFDWGLTWFGILMAMTIAVGQFTPPVAVNLMVTSRIAGVPLEASFRWVVWFFVAMVVALALVAAFPGLALWLPRLLDFRVI